MYLKIYKIEFFVEQTQETGFHRILNVDSAAATMGKKGG